MDSWARRRKIIYAFIVLILLVLVVGVPSFLIFYKAPTCFDGKQNGSEAGVDCGGRCEKLCQSEFLSPSVIWTRMEKVSSGIYNVAAYIINPNNLSEAMGVPFKVSLYDSFGKAIASKSGIVDIPARRNTLAYSALIDTGKVNPTKASFEFSQSPLWVKATDKLKAINVINKDYTEQKDSSALEVNLYNDSLYDIRNLTVFAILYDRLGNTIGFSKTVVDEIGAKSSAIAPFTWNTNRNGQVVSIEVLYVAE